MNRIDIDEQVDADDVYKPDYVPCVAPLRGRDGLIPLISIAGNCEPPEVCPACGKRANWRDTGWYPFPTSRGGARRWLCMACQHCLVQRWQLSANPDEGRIDRDEIQAWLHEVRAAQEKARAETQTVTT